MQTEDSQKIINRFFQALYYLKSQRIIRGKQTFTAKFGINRWNMNTLEKDMARDIFQPAWLTYLVEEYNISARWLLTGKGEIMQKDNGDGIIPAKPIKRSGSKPLPPKSSTEEF